MYLIKVYKCPFILRSNTKCFQHEPDTLLLAHERVRGLHLREAGRVGHEGVRRATQVSVRGHQV